MKGTKVTATTVMVLQQRPYLEDYMVCPLCGGLNVRENDECFVCRWSGDFDTTPVLIRMKVEEIVERVPELWGIVQFPETSRKGWGCRMRGAWDWMMLRLFGLVRRIDIRV